MTEAEARSAAAALGVSPSARLVRVGGPGSAERVWRVEGDGATTWLKLPGSDRALRREEAALRDWAPAMRARTPRVVAAHAGPPRRLLLSHVVGAPVDPVNPAAEVLRAAGRALAGLHAIPRPDTDVVPLADALEARFHGWVDRARRARIEVPSEVEALWMPGPRVSRARVPCHRDFAPRNWLWDPAQGLGVVDFAAAGPDHPWRDFLALWEAGAFDAPRGLEAFETGYGAPVPLGDPEFRALAALHCLATRVWAVERGDRTYADDAERGFRRLGIRA